MATVTPPTFSKARKVLIAAVSLICVAFASLAAYTKQAYPLRDGSFRVRGWFGSLEGLVVGSLIFALTLGAYVWMTVKATEAPRSAWHSAGVHAAGRKSARLRRGVPPAGVKGLPGPEVCINLVLAF